MGMVWGFWLRGAVEALFLRPRRSSNGNCMPLPPAPPRVRMRRVYLWSHAQMAECGGPCWKNQDPRCCDCGALWRDVPRAPQAFTEGPIQRGNGAGGPNTPKPAITPKPQFPSPRIIREDFLP